MFISMFKEEKNLSACRKWGLLLLSQILKERFVHLRLMLPDESALFMLFFGVGNELSGEGRIEEGASFKAHVGWGRVSRVSIFVCASCLRRRYFVRGPERELSAAQKVL